MMTEDLKGTLVLVHPELAHDPAGKQNQIGIISYTDLVNDDVFVSFGYETALYATDALLMLLPQLEIYQYTNEMAFELALPDLKTLTQIELLLRYGTAITHETALQLARDNKNIQPFCLDTLQNQLQKDIDQNYSR
jgi:hypothetical protein